MFVSKKQKAIAEKVDKLKVVRFIREVQFLTWQSDVILVEKVNGKWWMCVDFTNLN